MALLSQNKPSTEIITCGDITAMEALMLTIYQYVTTNKRYHYNMTHTVDFPTTFQNGHSSAIDNIFMDKSRMQSYVILPLSNA